MEPQTTPEPNTAPKKPDNPAGYASPQGPIPVMDVQPPRQPVRSESFQPRTQQAAPPQAAQPAAAPQNVQSPQIEVEEVPVAEEKIETYMGPTPDAAPPQSGVKPAPPEETKPVVATVGGAKHKSSKKLLIVGTLIIFVLLAASAAAYLMLNKSTSPAPAAGTAPVVTVAEEPVTAETVDETISELDSAAAGLDGSQAFAEEDLNDSSLGL